MSPGGTMMRIYTSLKRRIMDGEFAPGTRLDPARLRGELAASITPIRDALHRLTGEGLVESWQNEGFRIGYLSEPELRDLYDWSRLLTTMAFGSAASHAGMVAAALPASGYASEVTALLQRVAACSPNHELRRAMSRLCDRLFQYRAVEQALLPDAIEEVRRLQDMLADSDWPTAATAFEMFHRRRMALVPHIIAAMWDREADSR